MKVLSRVALFFLIICASLLAIDKASDATADRGRQSRRAGYRRIPEVAREQEIEQKFMAVPDPKLAEEHLRILTQAPHVAGIARRQGNRRLRGWKVPRRGARYRNRRVRVWFNYPSEITWT